MKKRVLLILSVIAVLVFSLSLASCKEEDKEEKDEVKQSEVQQDKVQQDEAQQDEAQQDKAQQDKAQQEESEQDKFIGSWEITLDMADELNAGMSDEDDELAEYLKIEELNVSMILTFKNDGTYKMYIDEEKVKKSFESVGDDIKEGLNEYVEDLIRNEGLDYTVDEYMELLGTDIDSLMETIWGDNMYSDLFIEVEASKGNFKAEDGKLYMSDGLDYEVDENEYNTYEISENKLKLIKPFGEYADEIIDFYPLTFKRVN